MDQGKFKKLAHRVEEALSQESLLAEPEQIDPSLIRVAPTNQYGAPPNVQHVQCGILKSLMTNGFDNTKPAIGICIKYTSAHGKDLIMDHNKRSPRATSSSPPSMRRQCMDLWQVLTTTWHGCASRQESRQASIHPLGPCLT